MTQLTLASWSATLGVALLALLFRSKAYALFRGLILSIYTLIAIGMVPLLLGTLSTWPAAARLSATAFVLWLHATVYLDPLFLIRPRLRPAWYRLLFSLPAQTMAATILLAWPWAIVAALGLPPWGWQLPFLLGLIGLYQSLTLRQEEQHLYLGHVRPVTGPTRLKADFDAPSTPPPGPSLRIVQITDPHIGPFMPVKRLARICQDAVDADPDFVFLTGDFLTMESQKDPAWLGAALAPLRALEGKCFACLGNHDHEAPRTVLEALTSAGITLLVDSQLTVASRIGPLQILGFDFHFRDRPARTQEVLRKHPREPGVLRLLLLHDPGAFKHLPDGAADLVFSGHTHGGQVGLVSLGHPWTIAHAVAKIPDHGLWAKGRNRMWVHRGTGHYGYPLRLGVPGEQSVLHLHALEQTV